jgi:hypothetical protein
VPISGSWTGFPSDSLGMEVEVEVTATAETDAAPKSGAAARGSRAAG